MSDRSDHEEKRMILKRPRKRPINIVSQWDYYDHDRKACQHLGGSYLAYKYNECLEMQMRIRKWVQLKQRRTTSTMTTTSTTATPVFERTFKYWYPGGYEYGQTTSRPPYAAVTRPPLLPPFVDRAEPPASSHEFEVESFVPLCLLLFMAVAVCFYVIIKCCKERKPDSVQRRPQGVQTTPLLPGARREMHQSAVRVRRASHEPLRIANSRPNNNDLPPPYSECVRSGTGKSEEPPPRYSACFLNLVDAEPQVHVRGQNVFDERTHSSTDIGNENGIRSKSLATSSNQSEDVAPRRRTELVFDTSRIV